MSLYLSICLIIAFLCSTIYYWTKFNATWDKLLQVVEEKWVVDKKNVELKAKLANLLLESKNNKDIINKYYIVIDLLKFYEEKGSLPKGFLESFEKKVILH